jgi:hypothetical protein
MLLLLSSCASTEPRVVVQKEPVYFEVVCPDPAKPAAIVPLKVRPQVIEDKIGIFWVGLTAKDYEALAVNIQEIIRYIKNQQGQVDYYRTCIVDFNQSLRDRSGQDPE